MGGHLAEEHGGPRDSLLLDLPIDIFIVIVKNLHARELAALSRVCSLLHKLVAATGWETYILSRPRPSISLSQHLDTISSLRKARYIHLTDRAWASRTSVIRPLALKYYDVRDASPYLVATPSMLVIAVANALHVYSFLDGGTSVSWRGSVALHQGGAHDDITGLGALNQGNTRGECVIVSLANGKVLRVRLSPNDEPLRATVTAHYPHPSTHITSLSTSEWDSKAGLALTTALGGSVSLYNTRSPWIEPTRIEALESTAAPGKKQARIWCSLVAQSDSLAITGSTQLSVYPISPTGLGTHGAMTLAGPAKSSACYALARPPGTGRDLVLSGWHDGMVRMYDLRTGAVELTMQDPWSDSAVYCVGAGGGSGAHVIAIFDVRSPTTGYTAYAPFSSLSPPRPRNGLTQVSSLHVEGARIFGTTPHLPFVLDFGPDVTRNTYPFVKEKSNRMTPDGRSFYYTMGYYHPSGYPEPVQLI